MSLVGAASLLLNVSHGISSKAVGSKRISFAQPVISVYGISRERQRHHPSHVVAAGRSGPKVLASDSMSLMDAAKFNDSHLPTYFM